MNDGDVISIVPSIAGGSCARSDSVGSERIGKIGWLTKTGFRRLLAAEQTATSLSNEEILRYSRHLIMPEVGMEGQLKLKAAKVLLIGAGGLGAPLGFYLAAAGVGRIGIVDFDKIDLTNLQRQVMFGSTDVGRPKIEAAAERMAGMNPDIQIDRHETRADQRKCAGDHARLRHRRGWHG